MEKFKTHVKSKYFRANNEMILDTLLTKEVVFHFWAEINVYIDVPLNLCRTISDQT